MKLLLVMVSLALSLAVIYMTSMTGFVVMDLILNEDEDIPPLWSVIVLLALWVWVAFITYRAFYR